MSIIIYEAATISTSPREELDVWLPKNKLRKNKNKIPLSSAHIYQIIIYSSQILYLY